jgi:hypothetical protein
MPQLEAFIIIVDRFLVSIIRSLSFSELPSEFFHPEVHNSAADAFTLAIGLYPSYSSLLYMAAPCASNGKHLVVKEPCHVTPPESLSKL